MRKVLFGSALIAIATAFPAYAGDIDIQLQSTAWDVNQVGIAGAISLATESVAKADVSNIVGMASVEGLNVDDITVNAAVSDVNQVGLAVAAAIDGYNPSNPVGRATAETVQVAGLVNIDAEKLDPTSDVLSQNTVGDVNQLGISLAIAGDRTTATVQQIAGVTVIDLDNVPSGADIGNIGLSVNDVNQVAGALALTGNNSTASVANLAGVGSVSVNIAD